MGIYHTNQGIQEGRNQTWIIKVIAIKNNCSYYWVSFILNLEINYDNYTVTNKLSAKKEAVLAIYSKN
jgi:hypothetical protein